MSPSFAAPHRIPQLTTWVRTFAAEQPRSWQYTFDVAIAADRAGIDRVALTGEHVCFGENLEAYSRPEVGGIAGGKQVTGPDGHYLEPIVTMSMIAALTKTVRFLPNIMLAALRRPVVLAKMAATLDLLSGGRLDLGVGVGWQREEYAAAGLKFEDRGRLLDQSLTVCRLLWSQDRACFDGLDLAFENLHMMPKPVTPGGVPIWVSGTVSAPAMRRLAKFGAGWIPWGSSSKNNADLIVDIPRMREAVAAHGRDPFDIQIAGILPLVTGADGLPAIAPSLEQVPRLVEAGITDFRAMLPVPKDRSAAEDYLAAWAAAFQIASGRAAP